MREKNKCQTSETLFNRAAMALALVSVVCILVIFFFPSGEGPYSVVHGPVTVMRAARAAAGVRMAVARAGLTPVRIPFSAALMLLPRPDLLEPAFLFGRGLSGVGPPLRC